MKNFETIERYLNGEMTPEERSTFEHTLRTDAALAKEYELHKQEKEVIEFAIEEDIFQEIKAIGWERQVPVDQGQAAAAAEKASPPDSKAGGGRVVRMNWRFALSAAASIAALLVVAYFAYSNWASSKPPQQVALSSYEAHPPNLGAMRKSGDADAPPATQQYEQQLMSDDKADVRAAIDFFASRTGEDPLADYLLGHGYWQLQQYGQSADYFQSFLQDDKAQGMEAYYNAQYYYILSLMAAGKTEAARAYFDGLEASHPFYGILEGVLGEVEG